MKIVDVHAHMDFPNYEKDLDNVIEECKKNNVKAIINNGVNKESNRKTLELAKKYSIIKPALGIYPTRCVEISEEEFEKEIEFIKKQDIIAIGEVGLDKHEIKNKINEMKKCFESFIELAEKKKIPIIVHSRNAELEAIETLEKMNAKKVVMHCFSGRSHLVKRIYDNGWYFSIPCNIIKSQQFQNIVLDTDLSRILTETDSPFISPYPGKRNQPSYIIESLKKIAELKKMDIEEVSNIIFENYQRLFL